MKITEVNDSNYEAEVIGSKKPFVLYFWAPWCKFCSIMTSRFENLEKQFSEKVKFGKLDIDKNEKTAKHNNLKGIPTIILYKNGREIGRILGIEDETLLYEKIADHLSDIY